MSASRRAPAAWVLERTYMRQDGVKALAWVVGMFLGAYGGSLATQAAFSNAEERRQAASLIGSNPAITFFRSGPWGAEEGTLVVVSVLSVCAVLVAVMVNNILGAKLRGEEENGLGDQVLATGLGRGDKLTVALLHTLCLLSAVGCAFASGLWLSGLEPGGSWLTGAMLVASGSFFIGWGTFTSNLATHRGTVSLINAGALAVAFILRGAGDVLGTFDPKTSMTDPAPLFWVSPLGWAQAVHPFSPDSEPSRLGFPLLMGAGLTLLGVLLALRRDTGAALLPERPGRERAHRRLGTPFGLACRASAPLLVVWTLGTGGFALMAGRLSSSAGTQLEGNAGIQQALAAVSRSTGDVTSAFQGTLLAMIAAISTLFAVMLLVRHHQDEEAGRSVPELVAGTPRTVWLGLRLLLILGGFLAGTVVVATAITVGSGGLAGGAGWPDAWFAAFMFAGMGAATSMAGAVAFGWTPRWTRGASWGVAAASIVVGLFGELFNLPEWAVDLSPFGHVPPDVLSHPDPGPALALWILTLALAAVALVGFRRRDLT